MSEDAIYCGFKLLQPNISCEHLSGNYSNISEKIVLNIKHSSNQAFEQNAAI